MKPDSIEFNIGDNAYGQPLRLARKRDSAGKYVWTLYRDAANQRDDSTFISGLTEADFELICGAVKSVL